MSQFKIFNFTNFKYLNAALLATTLYSLVPTKIEASTYFDRFTRQLPLLEKEAIQPSFKHSQDFQDFKNSSILRVTTVTNTDNSLLADNSSANNAAKQQESTTEFFRQLPFIFLLLFFVPLGIFYPLFLFYKMLLIKPEEAEALEEAHQKDNHKQKFPDAVNPNDSVSPVETEKEIKTETKTKINRATVSKLQIAFTPPANQLRQELSRATTKATLKPEYDLVDLMHQTVTVLIEQGHWTHISYSSITLPLEKVKQEFEFISQKERNKFINKTPDFLNYNRNVTSGKGYPENYSYVVVTLILCTSHSLPLFATISTKQQLVEELIKLTKMEKDSVIKFELLWNPQQEEIYISNEQLLIEYEELVRLF